MPVLSSRRRFAEYLEKRRKAVREGQPVGHTSDPDDHQNKRLRRHRSFTRLFTEFWRLLGPRRPLVLAALATLSVQALLVLLLPACTKAAIDYIITDKPGPAGIPRWIPIADSLRDPARRIAPLWAL